MAVEVFPKDEHNGRLVGAHATPLARVHVKRVAMNR
jgi:hypothetical protein